MRGRKPDLNTRTPKGKSQRPKIQPTTNPYRCKSRNSMAKASRCDWPKTDRKSAPRKSVRAAISFSVFTNIMRSEERRVGKEGGIRGARNREKKKKRNRRRRTWQYEAHRICTNIR